MLTLRPLIVVTGNIHVEGGISNRGKQSKKDLGDRDRVVITQEREISRDRRSADVIATNWARTLRGLRLIKTDFGTLVDPARLPDLKEALDDVMRAIGKFNAAAGAGCAVSNCVIWEHLSGNRRTHVAGWLVHRAVEDDAEVLSVLPQIEAVPERAVG